MEDRHKNRIQDNLSFLVKDTDYDRLRPELLKHKLFPATHLARIEERPNKKLELYLQVQRRGPTAFRRLLASLYFSGHAEALRVLTKDEDSLIFDACLMTDCSQHLSEEDSRSKVEGFDLTDSPLQPNNIVIEPATVLRAGDEMTYSMTSWPRGMALIIDNEDFETLPPRRGSHIDSDCLARLYRELGFWVVIKRNLRKISLEYELFSFATDTVHQQLDMAVVAILSHGENGSIICTNGEKVPIEDILSKFNNREAPPLKGKPKFFIFQSCRGLKIDPGVDTDGLDDDRMVGMDRMVHHHPNLQQRLPDRDLEILARDPSYEDIFVSYATIPSYVAYRNNMKGSWFVQCLCKVFMKHSCEEDLVSLLARVTQQLKTYCTSRGEKQVNETLLRGVTRRLFFNPGLVASPTLAINLELVKEDNVMEISTESFESDPLDDIWSGTGLATDSRVLCSQIG